MKYSLLIVTSLICIVCTSCTIPNPFSKDWTKSPSSSAEKSEIRSPEKLITWASENRKRMVDSLKTQWIDVSIFSADLLDANKTSDQVFATEYRKLWDLTDIPRRTSLVEYFKTQNLDVSGFTPEVIADGIKFEVLRAAIEKEMVKKAPIPVTPSQSQSGSQMPIFGR